MVDPHLHADDARSSSWPRPCRSRSSREACAAAPGPRGTTRGGTSRRRPADRRTATRTPRAPAFIARLHRAAHRAAERHAADELLGDALRQQRGVGLGPDSLAAWFMSSTFTSTRLPVIFSTSLRMRSTSAPLRPITMPGRAVRMNTWTWSPLRSMSMPEMPARVRRPSGCTCGSRCPRAASPRSRGPAYHLRLPGVDDPQPEPVRVNLVSHRSPLPSSPRPPSRGTSACGSASPGP